MCGGWLGSVGGGLPPACRSARAGTAPRPHARIRWPGGAERRRLDLVSPRGPVAEFLLHVEGDRASFRWSEGPGGSRVGVGGSVGVAFLQPGEDGADEAVDV
ncbi:hypothetical protein FAF44_08500 [Nonomuraea sp. MG754425]|nr:hypothetical protein [Nonomuraea sp. MG754425]